MKKHYYFFILFASLFFAAQARGATITVQPPQVGNGNETVAIAINTEGQSVNAIEAHLTFNPSDFSISGITTGGSVVDLWVEQPTFSNNAGTVDFSGIIPGGVDTENAPIVTITIVPQKNAPSAGFQVVSGSVLLNDGKGTPASLTTTTSPFLMTITSSTPSFALTTQVPDPFVPEVSRDSLIFNDQYFLSFFATDEGAGIDHYEVLEVPAGAGNARFSGWQVAQSPYLLKDQTLVSDIYVRAVDTAGNFRVEEIPAMHNPSAAPDPLHSIEILVGTIVLLLILGEIVLRIGKWKRKKRSHGSG